MAGLALIQQLQIQQTTNYLVAAEGALVVYDQVLTFPQEVNLVWNRQWSFTIALYLIARYIGSLYVIGNTALYMYINWTYSVIANMLLAVNCAENIFILTMQAILVIRVYALFNRSKKVLIFLATSYVLQATATFVLMGLGAHKRVLDEYYVSVGPPVWSVEQLLFTNANSSALPFIITLNRDSIIISIVFDSILLFFALWAFVRHALEAKTLEGRWSINVLVRTLVADQLLYFICNLAWLRLSLSLACATYTAKPSVFRILLYTVYYVFNALVVIAGPRMVISLRTAENKTRGEGRTLEGEVSTIRFGIRELPTQLESVMEEGGGFRAADENTQTD
ncbi:hypothetical protein BJ138DRAFT_523275 [Hygrophoropsis aurantiaca]|uniref:Uncharacterized protein n=1 Tax=Hygrophoropsis aurantiaca TaxID=72124 RepID=A0ACB8A2P8_9AGAM|nr:hypothetical protein BJ138DRAFT_523275 [Hygrophoropsis aurantiaca]